MLQIEWRYEFQSTPPRGGRLSALVAFFLGVKVGKDSKRAQISEEENHG
jgi:hypothetical protein